MSAPLSLTWDDRLASVQSARFKVAYQKLDVTNAGDDRDSRSANTVQLVAYCEAVKRLISQGVGESQAVQVLKQCGGDLDAAEVWIGVCSSVGLFSMCQPDDSSESWAWEGASGHLYFASSLREVCRTMQRPDSCREFSTVATLLEETSNAITAEMQQEVTQLEAARQQAEKAPADGLSIQDILVRLQASPGISKSKIVAIEEVLNPTAWNLYNKQRQAMTEPNEKWLFHGSGPENIAHIVLEGFDLKLANPQGAYGSGIYFASNISTSLGYTGKAALKAMAGIHVACQQQCDLLNTARSKGLQVILLCTVLLGRVGTGQAGQRQAPAGYDSVGGSSMNVVFKSEQAYPRYMVFIKP